MDLSSSHDAAISITRKKKSVVMQANHVSATLYERLNDVVKDSAECEVVNTDTLHHDTAFRGMAPSLREPRAENYTSPLPSSATSPEGHGCFTEYARALRVYLLGR